MSDTTITLPVTAKMVKQVDGSFKMVQATYITTDVSTVAKWLMSAFGMPTEKDGEVCGKRKNAL